MSRANTTLASPADRARWVSLLQIAAQEVFELMLASQLEIPLEPPPEEGLDITSMVGLAGELRGVMAVRCSSKSAARMAAEMLGIDADKVGPEMWDAVGEVCNMTAGNFKNKISGLVNDCQLSIPTVVTSADYGRSSAHTGLVRTVLVFKGEPIVISLEIHDGF